MVAEHSADVYVALIGDIRSSRDLEDRAEVQERFQALVDHLNTAIQSDGLMGAAAETEEPSVASPMTVTTGDEFQGLLRDSVTAVQAAIEASEEFDPADLRFGLGRGPLETDLNEEQAIGMDGPCFHRARAAVNDARSDGAWIRVAGWPGGLDDHVNRIFDLVQCVREDWTDRQAEFARALATEGTQTRIADQFDVSKSTVSESLSASHAHEVRAAEASLGQLLDEHLHDSEDRR